MIIEKVYIDRFRGFKEQTLELGSQISVIAGQNGTQKTTLLGLITQPFSIPKDNKMFGEKPLCGGSYKSAFSDKFRLSPKYDLPKSHEWTLSFKNDDDFTVESIPRQDGSIRFWQKGSREKGSGYKQYPTIFLSLKRLVPLAEEKSVTLDDSISLTAEEFKEFKKLHDKILIVPEINKIQETPYLVSPNKVSIGVNTDSYDWNQNSAGQDNIGKIILALFSFKRLKEKYKNSYQGGILAIDELDATMYPASQVELLMILRKYASKLNLQIIFTTHSLILLKSACELSDSLSQKEETKDHVRIIYLKKMDGNIMIHNNIDYESIYLNLNVTLANPQQEPPKVIVYTEDRENIIFAKAILKGKAKGLNFVDVTFSCGNLIELAHKKVPAFCYPYSIIIVDGDVKNDRKYMDKIKGLDNILILPGNISPERLLAEFLYKLSDADPLWEGIRKGFTKQQCFRSIAYDEIIAGGEIGRQNAKKWFVSFLPYWGSNATRVITPLMQSLENDCLDFIKQFEKIKSNFEVLIG